MKGVGTSWQGEGATRVTGMYLDDDGQPYNTQALGRDGLRIGDGFHDYLLYVVQRQHAVALAL